MADASIFITVAILLPVVFVIIPLAYHLYRRDVTRIEDIFWIVIVGAVTGSAIWVDMGGLYFAITGEFLPGFDQLQLRFSSLIGGSLLLIASVYLYYRSLFKGGFPPTSSPLSGRKEEEKG